MLIEHLDGASLTSRSKEKERIRGIRERMNAFIDSQADADLKREQKLFAEHPDLQERGLDPDHPRWFTEEYLSTAPLGRDIVSTWLSASFQVEIDDEGPNFGIVFTDASLVLRRGRDLFVNALQSEIGLNTSHVSEEWSPRADLFIVHTPDNIDGSTIEVPGDMPGIMPLTSPNVYEL